MKGGDRDVVKGREGEGRRRGWGGCNGGKREWVKLGEMKSRPQGERRERERCREECGEMDSRG